MALLSLTVLLGLAGILNAKVLDCDTPPPVLVVNDTVFRGLIGKWHYVIGATNNTIYQKMMSKTDNSFCYILPLNETAFYSKEATNMGDKCHEDEETPYILANNNTSFYLKGNSSTALQVRFLIPNVMTMLDYWEYTQFEFYYSVFVTAQSKDVSQETVEKFKQQLECFGFSKEEIFIPAKEKDACPFKEGENKYQKELEEYWAKQQSEDTQ
ncbi:uncharacterized protein LOC122790850 [Protopterus annectens]|uniref:uncharacterized protein LOC122790850 n=1 Tax=Protopterus annectens TaxID=7888 RepID=UPI001CF9E5C0|nr:uncharacterized protein LOC122790850 [Protopterus annectens]